MSEAHKNDTSSQNVSVVAQRRAAASPGAVDLPIEIAVECGQLELTVEEASRLRAGDVLRLGEPLSGEVSLTVGRRRIGRGRLVDVEGELGVELLEIES